ncbi:MAG: hypothetical protein F6K58_09815 [Symploca sp. SIO2E9]|nr:hypothetical protein [Symploca sp. SIO2E9]
MKTFLQVFSIAILVSITGLAGYAQTSSRKPNHLAQGQGAKSQEARLSVALPELATVRQKQGGSMTGQLTKLNQQELTISRGNSSESLAISQINNVAFKGDVFIIDDDDKRIRMRGPDQTSSGQQVWREVPLAAFNLQEPPEQAILSLGTVLSSEDLADILSISRDSTYVVQEILFESPGTMTIKAAPVD